MKESTARSTTVTGPPRRDERTDRDETSGQQGGGDEDGACALRQP